MKRPILLCFFPARMSCGGLSTMDLKRGSSPGCEDCFRRCWRKMLEGFICWRMQDVQTHDGRVVAVDIDRLEAVSEKALQSVFDLSMVVVYLPRGKGGGVVQVVAFERRESSSEAAAAAAAASAECLGKARVSLAMTICYGEDNTTTLPRPCDILDDIQRPTITLDIPLPCFTKATSKAALAQPSNNRSSWLASSVKVPSAAYSRHDIRQYTD